jgi:hypothetical protein
MEPQKEKISLDIASWRVNITERTKGRMKLQIKLSKDEAQAFQNFQSMCKPDEVSETDFVKTLLVTGMTTMEQQLSQLVQEYAKENAEELASSGITVLEGDDGQVTITGSNDISGV